MDIEKHSNSYSLCDPEKMQQDFESYKYHLPGAVLEVKLDINDPRVTFMNRIAWFLFGYDDNDLDETIMFPEMVATKEEYQRILQMCIEYFGESVLEGKPYERASKQELFEMRMKRKSGETFPAEVQASVIMDENKIPHTLVAVFRDISRRKLLEQDRERLIQELQKAIQDLKSMQGLVQICESCSRIQTRDGQWKGMDVFLGERSQIHIEKSICPNCE